MMNQTIKDIYNRKSVRQYTEQLIGEEEKEIIFDAIMQAPTAGNMSLFSVIEVVDQEIKDKLAKSCDNQPFIAKAPLVLIFLADYKRWYDMFEYYNKGIRKLGEGDLFLAISDTLIAAQNAVVAAECLEIGSCYIGDILENYEYHRDLLQLPKYVAPISMVCFGYPTETQKNRKKPDRFDKKYLFHTNLYTSLEIDSLKNMFKDRSRLEEDKLEQWVQAFYKRKFESEFTLEMSRSVKEILTSWTE